MNGYEYANIEDCVADGNHLTSVDAQGRCTYCGSQELR